MESLHPKFQIVLPANAVRKINFLIGTFLLCLLVVAGEAESASGVSKPQHKGISVCVVNIMAGRAFNLSATGQHGCGNGATTQLSDGSDSGVIDFGVGGRGGYHADRDGMIVTEVGAENSGAGGICLAHLGTGGGYGSGSTKVIHCGHAIVATETHLGDTRGLTHYDVHIETGIRCKGFLGGLVVPQGSKSTGITVGISVVRGMTGYTDFIVRPTLRSKIVCRVCNFLTEQAARNKDYQAKNK
jgi:hypothetical protein